MCSGSAESRINNKNVEELGSNSTIFGPKNRKIFNNQAYLKVEETAAFHDFTGKNIHDRFKII